MSIRVLLADDHEIVRRAIRRLLDTAPGIQVVAEAEDLHETLRATTELKPEVVVMDLHMVTRSAVKDAAVANAVAEAIPKLIAISYSNDEEVRRLAALCRAEKLLDKMTLAYELIPAIHQSVSA